MRAGVQRAVLQAMKNFAAAGGEPVIVENLVGATRLSKTQVFGAITELVKKGLVRRCGAGIYRLTPQLPPTQPTSGPHREVPRQVAVDVVGPLADGSGVVIRERDGGLRVARFE